MTYFPQYFLLAVSDKPGPEHSGIVPEENDPSVDAVSGNVEEEASCEKSVNQEMSSQSTDSTANSLAANNEPQPHPESSGLAPPDESSTRTSALQETDDSDDDPVLIPGARYRGGPGHRLGEYQSVTAWQNFFPYGISRNPCLISLNKISYSLTISQQLMAV